MKQKLFNKHSIFFTINLTFIISLIIITLSFTILFEVSKKKEDHSIKKRAIGISKMIMREQYKNDFVLDDEFKKHLSQLNYHWIESPLQKDQILTSEQLFLIDKFKLRRTRMHMYKLEEKTYIALYCKTGIYMIEDRNKAQNTHGWLIAIYLFIFAILSLLYLTIIKKLKPLQKLHTSIQKLSKEEFHEIDCLSDKKDEIALISNELHSTVNNLRKIKEARNIFIRNIMHELKTPITKGKLLSALEHTPANAKKMQTVFTRLESLIQEFASIEELISTKKTLHHKEYFLEDIIDESLDLLMLDDLHIAKNYPKEFKINVDFKIFTIAIKNLLDNALKYSTDKKAIVEVKENSIVIQNKAEPLKYPLEKYFEPFFKGDDIKSNESFGLGLYIVYHIIKAHNMKLEYIHKEGINHFIISK